jgi:hypothetical protein
MRSLFIKLSFQLSGHRADPAKGRYLSALAPNPISAGRKVDKSTCVIAVKVGESGISGGATVNSSRERQANACFASPPVVNLDRL